MGKKIIKNLIYILIFMLVLGICVSFADTDEIGAVNNPELVAKNLSRNILNVFKWFAYAISIGSLIFLGIKYMLSGANEKAEVKGLFIKFIIGIALIILCVEIASAVASFSGNDGAKEVIGVADRIDDYKASE